MEGNDLDAVKSRQRAVWSAGDHAVVGTTLQIVGENLCEALDIRSGSRVLDVAAGNGNVALAAARRWCDVVATDYVPALLGRAQERADADRLNITFREADAEALPFADARFDVVVSTWLLSDRVSAPTARQPAPRPGLAQLIRRWIFAGDAGCVLARRLASPFPSRRSAAPVVAVTAAGWLAPRAAAPR
ncbi:MAG TPA: class I SAM-dependent methyltransferase [Rhodospirillales bacterium]|nr:class I SAM-dependent methyltransferase [Rhodospirillales bacterium]